MKSLPKNTSLDHRRRFLIKAERAQLPGPNLGKGWEIFLTRSLSLISALIIAVAICVVSFFLLTFPVIAGYYYAVRYSRGERYFIDIENIMRTIFLVFRGIRIYFIQSYVFGFLGLLPIAILFFSPLLPWMLTGDQGMFLGLVLQILWIPAFFLTGIIVFHGYPHLIAANSGIGSLRYAFAMGKAKPLSAIGRGFLLLYPIPAAIFHFLMVFSYPILVGWAVAGTDDASEKKQEIRAPGEVTWVKLLLALALAGVMFGIIYFFSWLWGGPGFFIGLGLSFTLAILFFRKVR
jgi:hypothetical protein